MIENYEPRKSCKDCAHYENGDWDNDKCLKIECESRCDDEKICMNDLENFYQQGRADGFQQGVDDTTKRYKDSYMARDIKQIRADAFKPIAKIIDDFACGRIEQSLSALNLINHSIAEQLKEQTE